MSYQYHPFGEYSYRGEGNANLVIAHHTQRMVIRFRKSLLEELPKDGGLSRVNEEIEFSKNVMLRLLGLFIDVPKVVYCDRKNLDKLFEKIQEDRPSNRLSKAILEEFATQLPDYSVLIRSNLCPLSRSPRNSVFCVEIKPKQGFICKMDQVLPICPYCLKQFYKAKTFTHKKKMENYSKKCPLSHSEKNQYCPFELFSGNPCRMKQALKNLMDNPQNNLKIFRKGLCVYQENSHGRENCMQDIFPGKDWKDSLSTLLVKILLRPFVPVQDDKTNVLGDKIIEINSNIDVPPRIDPVLRNQALELLLERDRNCRFPGDKLPGGSVLERIMEVQKLHQHGEDIVYSIYSKYREVLKDEDIHSSLLKRAQDGCGSLIENLNSRYENMCTLDAKENSKTELIEYANENGKSEEIEGSYPSVSELCILQNYLLFSTLRDCSIMVAFQYLDPKEENLHAKENVLHLSEKEQFVFNVKISDVDLKKIRCIEKHRKRDEKIMNAVISTLS